MANVLFSQIDSNIGHLAQIAGQQYDINLNSWHMVIIQNKVPLIANCK